MEKLKERNHLFPVFLKLENLRLLIVGGGNVCYEKLTAVSHNSPGTNIVLVAKKISPEVRSLAGQLTHLTLHERPFAPADLDQADIVFIAINDRTMSHQIYIQAKKRNRLVNVADTPDLCDFYLGSIVQKGHLKLAISTNGKSPTIAKRLREMLSEALPDTFDEVLDNIQIIRKRMKGNFQEKVNRLNEITKVLVESPDSL